MRALGTWAFQKGSRTCQGNQCRVPPSAKPGELFGVSLMDVCDKENLPTPVLVGHLIFVFSSAPEEGKLGEAKCPHPDLSPNGEVIRQPLALAEKLCYCYLKEWNLIRYCRVMRRVQQDRAFWSIPLVPCFHKDPRRPVQISQNGLCVCESLRGHLVFPLSFHCLPELSLVSSLLQRSLLSLTTANT